MILVDSVSFIRRDAPWTVDKVTPARFFINGKSWGFQVLPLAGGLLE